MKSASCLTRAGGVISVFFVLAGGLRADWNEGDPYKWVQHPDLTTDGMDVRDWKHSSIVTNSRTLADDWECRVTGNITNIHIWGSWSNDITPQPANLSFTLAIHADIPGPPYSRPGNVLWSHTFSPGSYQWRVYESGIQEGWYDPYITNTYKFPGDTVCYQYNFPITTGWFMQTGTPTQAVTYWLEVQAVHPLGSYQFGWKTSYEHWNDRAVYARNNAPAGGGWQPMSYPIGHPKQTQPIDLSFVIQGEQPAPDVYDFGDAPDPFPGVGFGNYQTLQADGGAYHMIMPGGPFFDDGTGTDQPDSEPDGQPDPNAWGDDLGGVNDEKGISFPGTLYQGRPGSVIITVDDGWGGGGAGGAFVDAWIDYNGDGDWTDPGEQIQSGWLGQGPNTVGVLVPFSAKTGQTFARFRINSMGAGLPPTGGPTPDGEVEDHQVWIQPSDAKWIQGPDLTYYGMDVEAMKNYPYLLADDFLCTSNTTITNIVIWGSWFHDLLPQGSPSNVIFFLSIHADVPAGQQAPWSMPGPVLWWTNFTPGQFSARPEFTGLVEGWYNPATSNWTPNADTVCWRYEFPVSLQNAFVQTGSVTQPITYWLDVQAVPLGTGTEFGWKTSTNHWNDDAVWAPASDPYNGFWWDMRYPQGHGFYPQSIDLAFALYGGPPPVQDLFDFGDAPDWGIGTGPGDYQTTRADGGAYHRIVTNSPFFDDGSWTDQPDAEADGQPDPSAWGDDNVLSDDEDGISFFPWPLVQGQPGVVTITVDDGWGGVGVMGAYVDAWIDFNRDGDWTDLGEQIQSGWLGQGPNPVGFVVPAVATTGQTFARFRINSRGAGLPPTGGPAFDGEVEDHEVWIEPGREPPKWRQAPDLSYYGMDVDARRVYNYNSLLADDFLCTSNTAITNIVIWGSWLGDKLPLNNPSNVTFFLSIHADIPAGQQAPWSMPGPVLWWTNLGPGQFTARPEFQGLTEGWYIPSSSNWFPNADWTCWRYEFPISLQDAFVQTGSLTHPVVYWLDVQAMPMSTNEFGWKTSTDHWNDDAVWASALDPYNGFWWEMRYPSGHPYHPQSIDLAFELYGGPAPQVELDWGDAPDPAYPTLAASGGANHRIGGPWLGDPTDAPDAEPDGQPNASATGDDADILYPPPNDDEDGIGTLIMIVGANIPVGFNVNNAPLGAWVELWVDWNGNGTWGDDPSGYYSGNFLTGPGSFLVSVPTSAVRGLTFARVRISTSGVGVPTGPAADGEVEDHRVWVEERFDFGDAPVPYPTLANSNGACHVALGPWLGDLSDAPDYESDGQPAPGAVGDDNNGATPDDEDGVTFPTLIVGLNADIVFQVSGVSGAAYIAGHIDWNADGDWDDAGETYAFWPSVSADGVYTSTVAVPLSAARGTTYARVRISQVGYGGPYGLISDGEVEDHRIHIEERFDFADAPNPYPTLLASNGAQHIAVGPWLGDASDAPDIESDGQPDPNAAGDDTNGATPDDENGVAFPTLIVGANASVVYQVSGVSGAAYVSGHLDWNADGDWDDAGEAYASWSSVSADGVYTSTVAVPLGAARGTTYARVRISAAGGYGPYGLASDGEVEDYKVNVEERFDFGDAPNPYPTLLASNGAQHIAVGPWLGDASDAPDIESDGQPDPGALGDDNNGTPLDDEDGVWFPTLIVGANASVVYQVSGVSGTAFVSGHIDWNADGDWDDAGETYAFWPSVSADGVYTSTVAVPLAAARGTTFARVRVSAIYWNGPGGLVFDGEVEDHAVTIEERFDYADAPRPYPTLAASNGAYHVVTGPSLGDFAAPPDWEPDGQPEATARGDDVNNIDDENGVVFPNTLVAGTTTSISFYVTNAVSYAYVEIWIDWNRDGDWSTSGDYVYGGWHNDGWYTVAVGVPTAIGWGDSFARVRISTAGVGSPVGPAADGEVEDYLVRLAGTDFGDAPDPRYPTLLINNGARHLLRGDLWMSPAVDSETDGQPTPNADGDDVAGADDEDGVILPPYVRQDGLASVTVSVTRACYLNAWMDFNADGDWNDTAEQIFTNAALAAGANGLTFHVPLHAAVTSTFARFRVSSTGGDLPTGQADDGEVEDYPVTIYEKFPPALGLKWRQPPDCSYGLNLHSWSAPDPLGAADVGPVVADDWWCDGRPIKAIRWWGSYILYGGPTNPLQVTRPYAFRLSWYLDRPTNYVIGFSRPGRLLKQTIVPLIGYQQPARGPDQVTEFYRCTVPLDFLGATFSNRTEHKFEYEVVLSEPWLEKNTLSREEYLPPASSNVYWLAIEAVYYAPPESGAHAWGWETTAQRFNWNDDAVIATNTLAGMTPWKDLTYIPQVWPWSSAANHPYKGQSVNMAFNLLSDVVGRRDLKWRQLPNMVMGTDMSSWRYVEPLFPPVPWASQALRADDFVSDGRRITDIHWWGSYLGWSNDIQAGEFNPVPPPTGANRPIGFDLSWHTHDPTLGGPGAAITNVFVPIARCHEMYYCTLAHPTGSGYPWEHEYQYYVDLLDEQLELQPWAETNNVHYWLNIQAVFDNSFFPAPPGQAGIDFEHEGWGWKISGVEPQIRLVPSVVTNYTPPSVGWQFSQLPWWHPRAGALHDLSFELTTDRPNTAAVIVVNALMTYTNGLSRVGSVGTANVGEQRLQVSVMPLNVASWVDVETNQVPFPLPAQNIWLRTAPLVSNEHYRVIEVP